MPPAPKPAAQRQRKNRTTTAAVLEAGAALRITLPERNPDWHPMTRSWWAVIWASPMTGEWVDADTPGLLALARLVDAFWSAEAGDAAKIHAEIRMASREFGLSPLSRRSLQWEVKRVTSPVRPAPAPAPRRGGARSMLSVLQGKAG